MLPQQAQKSVSLETRTKHLQHMHCWKIAGRISINNGQENINASFTWQQTDQKYHIYFYSPFTSDSITILGDNNGFRVTGTNNAGQTTFDLEKRLPFAQLKYWLKGMPAPQSPIQIVAYDRQNQLKTLQQDGWLLEFQSYGDNYPISLPQKLSIRDGQLNVKLLIKNWQN